MADPPSRRFSRKIERVRGARSARWRHRLCCRGTKFSRCWKVCGRLGVVFGTSADGCGGKIPLSWRHVAATPARQPSAPLRGTHSPTHPSTADTRGPAIARHTKREDCEETKAGVVVFAPFCVTHNAGATAIVTRHHDSGSGGHTGRRSSGRAMACFAADQAPTQRALKANTRQGAS